MQKGDQERINRNLFLYFDTSRRIDIISPGNQKAGFKLNTGNTLEHELKKCEVVYNCLKQGRSVVVEAILKTGNRPDVVCLDLNEPIAYEIIKSESTESINLKKQKYPFRLIECKV